LNSILATKSRFVGTEILVENKRHIWVNHFRIAVALPLGPSGAHFRIPVTAIDLYVDVHDSTVFWKVLQFGFQNLYDPELNEYIVITKHCKLTREIELPIACQHCPPKTQEFSNTDKTEKQIS
jgi:hypothetical protein